MHRVQIESANHYPIKAYLLISDSKKGTQAGIYRSNTIFK